VAGDVFLKHGWEGLTRMAADYAIEWFLKKAIEKTRFSVGAVLT